MRLVSPASPCPEPLAAPGNHNINSLTQTRARKRMHAERIANGVQPTYQSTDVTHEAQLRVLLLQYGMSSYRAYASVIRARATANHARTSRKKSLMSSPRPSFTFFRYPRRHSILSAQRPERLAGITGSAPSQPRNCAGAFALKRCSSRPVIAKHFSAAGTQPAPCYYQSPATGNAPSQVLARSCAVRAPFSA